MANTDREEKSSCIGQGRKDTAPTLLPHKSPEEEEAQKLS